MDRKKKHLRTVGAFALNLVAADALSDALAVAYVSGSGVTMADFVTRTYLLNISAAIGLSVVVWYKFRSVTAKWIWILPVVLLGIRTLVLLSRRPFGQDLGAHVLSVASILGGGQCNANWQSCLQWRYVTMPACQAIAYSAASYLCFKISDREIGKTGYPDD
ncbi:MAG: hypothetical protein ABL967_19640 [Bryobacteraceae bacterium]